MSKFNKLHQSQFLSITHYVKNLEIMAEKIAIVLDISEKEKNALITTNFFAGLASHTAIYLQRENVKGVQKAKKELEKLETILFSEATPAIQAQIRPTTTPAEPPENKMTPIQGKRCIVHPNNDHNNEDCIVQKIREREKLRAQNDKKNNNTIAAIIENQFILHRHSQS
ncbi:hypothetical protein M153_5860001478 [Pseudoloma neurophilia]|uniref:Uncharacterized protein n=1 Tax=Pseudoloma neurophilia TaxID=146866 RepID=A0A0R0LWM5_9MICR|nr:hypothetical protein M153_5860001478 [Pseudoloma neurophilia]